jgi:hypothetical protein
MMNKVYLHRDDIVTILQFMDSFDRKSVLITSDTSSGIGSILKALLEEVDLNGNTVNIEKTIADEKDW